MPAYELSERERDSLSKMDSLNAILSMSSIKEGSESAQIRAREQASARLQKARARASRQGDMETLMLKAALDKQGGPFEGTGIEAQMLNIMMDPNIPDDHPQKIAARQRLERVQTVSTPEGVHSTPGYDFGGGTPAFTPRVKSGDEKRGDLAVAQIQSADPQMVKPNIIEEMAQEMLPPSVASLFTTDAYDLDLNEQRQLLSNTIYLQSGAAASPQEVEKRRLEFFPQSGNSDETIAAKKQNLEAFKADALAAFQSRGGAAGDPGGSPSGSGLSARAKSYLE